MAQGAFPRRMPARLSLARKPRAQTRHRARRFAPACRLPMLFCLSLERGRTRPRRYRRLFAHGRSTPRTARRLLQSERSTSTTIESPEPRRDSYCRLSPIVAHSGLAPSFGGARSRSPGSGAGSFVALAITSSLRDDCSYRRLSPNPIGLGHLLSQARDSYRPESRRNRSILPASPAFAALAPGLACARPAGPLPAPLREEEMRSAAPEVPSIVEPPRRGGPLSTSCPQAVEYGPVPLQPPLVPFL